MNTPNDYIQLMKRAETTTSRKEARHLINESTRLMENNKTKKPCYYSKAELKAFLNHHQEALSKHEAQANVARQMIVMIEGLLEEQG